MAKKDKSGGYRSKPQNQHLLARIAHLHRASTFLSTLSTAQQTPTTSNLARFYNSTLRSVAKKSVVRVDRSVKRTICKRCDTLLVPGSTSIERVENNSKDGKKPWADVLVIECKKCGAVKRFPIGMDGRKEKPKRIPKRSKKARAKGGGRNNSNNKTDGSKENAARQQQNSTTANVNENDHIEPKFGVATQDTSIEVSKNQ